MFWVALLTPIFIGGALASFIALNEQELSWCLTSKCVQYFFEIYKFPIAIAGVSLPLVAMVAAIHRSSEAYLQIKNSQRQFEEAVSNNRFGNHLKHREGFEKLLTSYVDIENGDFDRRLHISLTRLYSYVYPDSGFKGSDWVGQYDVDIMDKMKNCHCVLVEEVKKDSGDLDFERFIISLNDLVRLLRMGYSTRKYLVFHDSSGKQLNIPIPKTLKPHYGVVVAAFDAIEIYLHVAAYSGLKVVDELKDFDTDVCIENIEGCRGLYVITNPMSLIEEMED